jgi:hypothetical protein
MPKFKVVLHLTTVNVYRQVEYIDAATEQEAEDKVYDIKANFSDLVDQELENVETISVTELTPTIEKTGAVSYKIIT